MCLHVAHKVGTENQTGANLPLHSDVHLDRARRSVVRIKRHAIIESESLTKQRSEVGRVRRSQIKRRVGLIQFLKRNDLTAHNSDCDRLPRCSAECWLQVSL